MIVAFYFLLACIPKQPHLKQPLNLYRLSKKGQPISYLFGTCHYKIPLAKALPPSTDPIVEQSNRFIFEVSANDKNTTKISELIALKEGQSLDSLLGSQVWKELIVYFDLGLEAMFINTLHPFVMYSYALSELLHPRKNRLPIARMDVELEHFTLALKKEQYFLESMSEQLNLLTQQPMEPWLNHLKELSTPEGRMKLKKDTEAILSVCLTGDEQYFMNLQAQFTTKNDALQISERNHNWLPIIQQHLSEDSTFIAVGVAHLYGEDGLLNLLKKQGWSQQRIYRK